MRRLQKPLPATPLAVLGRFRISLPLLSEPQDAALERETDPLILQKLDQWRDWKFGGAGCMLKETGIE